jgi:hypothetical protein
VAYVARQGTEDSLLYLRDLDSVEPRVVAGSNGARQPSPGQQVVASSRRALQKAEARAACGAPRRGPYPGARDRGRHHHLRGSMARRCGSLPVSTVTSRSPTAPTVAYVAAGTPRRTSASRSGQNGGSAVLSPGWANGSR